MRDSIDQRKDGEIYSEEGIYTFTVKNLYSDSESTTKTLYVGTSPILKALSFGYGLEEINELLSQGAELKSDGTIEFPKIDEQQTEESIASENAKERENTLISVPTEKVLPIAENDGIATSIEMEEERDNNISIVVVVIVFIVVIGIFLRRKTR